MNTVRRILTSAVMVLLLVAFIAACGGGGTSQNPNNPPSNGGGGSTITVVKQLFRMSPSKTFFYATQSVKKTVAQDFNWSLVPTANAQAPSVPTIGRNNISGFCGTLPNPPVSVAAVVPFGLGNRLDGRCTTPDVNGGVVIPEDGWIGNFTIDDTDTIGTRNSDQSGRVEYYINGQLIHTITRGVDADGHTEDLQSANGHVFQVHAGDKVKVRYWQQAGDHESNIEWNIGFGKN
jgi:hypothetical protein